MVCEKFFWCLVAGLVMVCCCGFLVGVFWGGCWLVGLGFGGCGVFFWFVFVVFSKRFILCFFIFGIKFSNILWLKEGCMVW